MFLSYLFSKVCVGCYTMSSLFYRITIHSTGIIKSGGRGVFYIFDSQLHQTPWGLNVLPHLLHLLSAVKKKIVCSHFQHLHLVGAKFSIKYTCYSETPSVLTMVHRTCKCQNLHHYTPNQGKSYSFPNYFMLLVSCSKITYVVG